MFYVKEMCIFTTRYDEQQTVNCCSFRSGFGATRAIWRIASVSGLEAFVEQA